MTQMTEAWPYRELDPELIRQNAYATHSAGGGCMHAVSRSIIEPVAQQLDEPHNSFPYHIMVYGFSGVVGSGSLCGAVNGACAAIGLFITDYSAMRRVTVELLDWVRETELPQFVPESKADVSMPQSVCDSLLCIDMLKEWSDASKQQGIRASRSDRCRRLSADLAGRTAELLNQHFVQ